MKQIASILIYTFIISTSADAQYCRDTATGFIPLADLGKGKFMGFAGGKYPDGKNAIPLDHFLTGMQLSSEIKPLNKSGEPDENGKTGFMILGFSTAAMTARTFISICKTEQINPEIEFVIGAQGGRDINSMTDQYSDYWTNIDTALEEKNITAKQIQIIWISTGDIRSYQLQFPEQCYVQIEKYNALLKNIRIYFPNTKLVFISDRPFAGYIGGENGGPVELAEPSAYYNSWTVKWVIENQIENKKDFTTEDIPFIDWGPLLWTDGEKGNQLGYSWLCSDAGKGGIHPTSKGRMKEAALLYLFFTQHPYTKEFFKPGN